MDPQLSKATPTVEFLVKQWEQIDQTDDVLTLFDEVKITKDADPSKVSDRAQTVLCRELGVVQPDLKQYWPRHSQTFSIFGPSDINDDTRSFLSDLLTMRLPK